MPIYEYDCPVCGRFEVMESASKKPMTKCPQCAEKGKSNKVTRVMSASAFHLKGGGWYKTDYGGTGSKGSKKSSESTSTSSDTGGSTSTEKKETDSKEKTSLKTAGCGGNCSCH